MALLKRFTKSTWVAVAALVLLLVAFIIAVVSGTSGYLAGKAMNPVVLACSIIALIILVALPFIFDRISNIIVDVLIVAVGILIAVSIGALIWDRTPLAADVWFIPVNYPAAEEAALNTSIVGAVFYLLSLICLVVLCFFDDPLLKTEEKAA